MENRGEDVITEGNVICDARGSSSTDRMIILKSSKDPAYCNAVPQCKSGSDQSNCTILTLRLNSKTFKITREEHETGLARRDDQDTIVCRKWRDVEWLILDKDSCEYCNLVPNCDFEIDGKAFDEYGCPVYTSPSFEYPIYCSLVVLILGVLLHLGWNAVTR